MLKPMLEPAIGPMVGSPFADEQIRPFLQVYDSKTKLKRKLTLTGTSYRLKVGVDIMGAAPGGKDFVFCASDDGTTSYLGLEKTGANFIVIIKGVKRLIPVPKVDMLQGYLNIELAPTDPNNLNLVLNNQLLDNWESVAHAFELQSLFATTAASSHAEFDYLIAENQQGKAENMHYVFNIGEGSVIPNVNPLAVAGDDLTIAGTVNQNYYWDFHA
ncbi:hypothetical protein [Vibrio sp. SCSIO 43136]|uniref:hypothetical protein n=1 Tax=Vibrio sp. SCSIO 43136 TaxID=2819101 RepID=UPI0020764426|nr:hypothetical protein [Vibrio sp. SCSIO 43136]USD68123.1 hypothetical protein J4N39_18285 [Vibrio sp. SCSIO 43136]